MAKSEARVVADCGVGRSCRRFACCATIDHRGKNTVESIRKLGLLVHRSVLVVVLAMALSLVAGSVGATQSLQPFTSDGCSAFPDGTWQQQQLWLPCCVAHDYAYWQGGTEQQRISADAELQQCVSTIGEPEIASVMLAGVRVGGSPYLPTPFRWGYGWSEFRGYQGLSSEEIAEVAKSLAEHPLQLPFSLQQPPAVITVPAVKEAVTAPANDRPSAIPVH